MQWMIFSTFFCAASAVWCGLAWLWTTRVLNAVRSVALPAGLDPKSERRLQDCESLLSELVSALSRIEARDKMRRVRAGIPATGAETPTAVAPGDSNQTAPASRDSRGRLSDLSSAEIRRRIAQRIPLT